MVKEYFNFRSPVYRRRLLMSLCGVVICAVSVGIFKEAALGVDPFQSFSAGLDAVIPLPFGTVYMLANLVLLLFSLIADRHYIGIATFINLFLLGYITQFTYALLRSVMPSPGIAVRIICLLIGIVVICFSSSLYMTANLGVSTYDAIALIISNTWGKWKFRYVRICCDLVCVILGGALCLLAGGTMKDVFAIIGVGTIVTAFFMGPLIEVFNEKISRPFLRNAEKK